MHDPRKLASSVPESNVPPGGFMMLPHGPPYASCSSADYAARPFLQNPWYRRPNQRNGGLHYWAEAVAMIGHIRPGAGLACALPSPDSGNDPSTTASGSTGPPLYRRKA